ncbi:putative Histone-lysine N-methyltransferase EHMT1 [Hypsibius exemplaris]|uniref:Histone-lysine N-methyltransferase EHMT1 n=1 Tax=Hypsibius exemplaris TaxID=2072580 RepID=A0A1W0WK69_HYPEX|nr:putative Histone-lysine N-methyltransferase EHMT1 [Hypsibius exemplaris]
MPPQQQRGPAIQDGNITSSSLGAAGRAQFLASSNSEIISAPTTSAGIKRLSGLVEQTGHGTDNGKRSRQQESTSSSPKATNQSINQSIRATSQSINQSIKATSQSIKATNQSIDQSVKAINPAQTVSLQAGVDMFRSTMTDLPTSRTASSVEHPHPHSQLGQPRKIIPASPISVSPTSMSPVHESNGKRNGDATSKRAIASISAGVNRRTPSSPTGMPLGPGRSGSGGVSQSWDGEAGGSSTDSTGAATEKKSVLIKKAVFKKMATPESMQSRAIMVAAPAAGSAVGKSTSSTLASSSSATKPTAPPTAVASASGTNQAVRASTNRSADPDLTAVTVKRLSVPVLASTPNQAAAGPVQPNSIPPYAEFGKISYKTADQYPTYVKPQLEPHATCTVACKFGETQKGVEEYVKVVHNPLIIPLLFGWFREVTHKKYGRGTIAIPKVQYISPCGKTKRTPEQLAEYLRVVQSIFPMTLFTFDVGMDLWRKFNVEKCHIKAFSEDLAKRMLNNPYTRIPVVNCFTDQLPADFSYIKKNSKSQETVRLLDLQSIRPRTTGCSCVGYCGEGCLCGLLRSEVDGDSEDEGLHCGRLRAKQDFIVECNDFCSCGPNCGNRTTTNTLPFPLMMYYYPDKGWGVRAFCDIPAGAFVAFYLGQIIAEKDTNNLGDKYLVSLDFYGENAASPPEPSSAEEDEGFLIDGRRFGNVARFFNHSCEPNMFTQVLYREYYSNKLYNIAFFTLRTIKAGEELTWDYKYEVDSVPGRSIVCLCKSRFCRGRML